MAMGPLLTPMAALLSSIALAFSGILVARKLINILLREQFVVHSQGAIVITGASSGIGRHAAEFLASRGFTVFAGVRKEKDVENIKASQQRNLLPLLVDVNSHDSIKQAVANLADELKRMDLRLIGLVNNAGVGESFAAEFHPLENARGMFETNFWGAVDLTRECMPLLRKARGRVVMISSVAALVSQPMTAVYSASKRALEGFTDSFRQEVKHFGISVSMLEPAYVNTDLLSKAQALRPPDELSPDEQHRKEQTEALYPHYASVAHKKKKLKTMKNGDSPQVTTNAIYDALTNPFPLTRYVVASVNGTPAWVIGWLFWAAPDRLKDYLIANI